MSLYSVFSFLDSELTNMSHNYQLRDILPSGKPELIRISLSCTLASQVILSVAILSLFCSQKRISASSPLILKQNGKEAFFLKGSASLHAGL